MNDTTSAKSPSKALSPSERAAFQREFEENGFVTVRDVVVRDRLKPLCDEILAAYDEAKRSGGVLDGGGHISGHLNLFPGAGARFVYETLVDRGIIELVKAITPRPFTGPAVRGNLNLPGSVAQHNHIDGIWLDDFTILNVTVVDTDVVNGATEVIPGTHKRFIPYWRFALERMHRFGKQISSRIGDVVIRTSRLWHRGMPNQSSKPRPMLAFTFGDKNEKILPDPFSANDGKVQFYENWYRPTRLGRLRERTFVSAPITYSAYRIVDSIVDPKKLYGKP